MSCPRSGRDACETYDSGCRRARLCVWLSFVCALPGHGRAEPIPSTEQVGVDEHVGGALPRDVLLTDHTGAKRSSANALTGDVPVLLQLGVLPL